MLKAVRRLRRSAIDSYYRPRREEAGAVLVGRGTTGVEDESVSAGRRVYGVRDARLFNRGRYLDVMQGRTRIVGPSQPLDPPSSRRPRCRIFQLPRRVNEPVISIATAGGHGNYYHWLYEALPRLHLLKHAKSVCLRRAVIYVSGLRFPFQLESLRMLGIDLERCLSAERFPHITTSACLVTDHPYKSVTEPRSHWVPEWITKWHREALLPWGSETATPARVFVGRKDSRIGRGLVNEDEVFKALETVGYERVLLSRLSLPDQIALFRGAEAIVAAHGAGLANLAFCSKGCRVVEITNDDLAERTMFAAVAGALELDYVSVMGQSPSIQARPTRASYAVDVAAVLEHAR